MNNFRGIDMTGQKFGRLTVLERVADSDSKSILWRCHCECGTTCEPRGVDLRRGVTRSCGCLQRSRVTTHGHAKTGRHSPEYVSWTAMTSRCANQNDQAYDRYGGRGIRVSERWQSFENFLEDMGERPPGTSLDRYPDPDGNYELGNCRWATSTQQANNRRLAVTARILDHDGLSLTISEWSAHLGIHKATLGGRLARGWSVHKALTVPPKRIGLGQRRHH